MTEYKKAEKAYKNLDFLTSPSARTVRILSEYYEPKSRFEKLNVVDTIVFFGSARFIPGRSAEEELEKIKQQENKDKEEISKKLTVAGKTVEMSKYYDDAVELSEKLTRWSMNLPTEKQRFIICSGGGPGIMEAANRGAKQAGGYSAGLNISIPFEQFVNKYVDNSLSFEFHYFFMRKFWFMYLAKALVIFPGGFGTLDELMELLTLQQTGKINKPMTILIYGKKYWEKVINFDAMVEYGTISRDDLDLFHFCDDVDKAFEHITGFLEKHYPVEKEEDLDRGLYDTKKQDDQ